MITARVVASYGTHGIVAWDGKWYECQWRRSVGRPVCGDLVELRVPPAGAGLLLERICERRTVFIRADRQLKPQIIAANLEQMVIVIAPKPAPSAFALDRYLLAAVVLGLKPLVVCNKADLSAGAGIADPEQYKACGAIWHHTIVRPSSPGYGTGLEALRRALADKASILVGQSGVGKSSLLNALTRERPAPVAELSTATGKGRHTTTLTRWYPLPDGGALVDSPGVWEYGLWRMPVENICRGFPEFAALPPCRFRDCRHKDEPGCQVAAAVSTGKIHPERHAAYLQILASPVGTSERDV